MILQADARHIPLADGSVHCVVTSPPYWGLRDYGLPPLVWGGEADCAHVFGEDLRKGGPAGAQGSTSQMVGRTAYEEGENTTRGANLGAFCRCGAWRGCLGLEPTPDLYVAHMVEVFREVRRVLRDDGTCWLNLGDSYATGGGQVGEHPGGGEQGARWRGDVDRLRDQKRGYRGGHNVDGSGKAAPRIEAMGPMTQPNRMPIPGLKPKDMVGIPWRVAFALQADGWWLRSDIIWSKPNPMPESVTDRPTKSHEYLFLLAKSEQYYYDAKAIKEPALNEGRIVRQYQPDAKNGQSANPTYRGFLNHDTIVSGRNRRSVWEIATQPYPEAHFATFPEALVEPCVLAGTSEVGCCPECGAPWERVLEPEAEYAPLLGRDLLRKNEHPPEEILQKGWSQQKVGPNVSAAYRTVAWESTCACRDQGQLRQQRPLVLDPFAGSGTVGEVCHRLGRRFVGLDLKAEYCRMAYARTAQLGLL